MMHTLLICNFAAVAAAFFAQDKMTLASEARLPARATGLLQATVNGERNPSLQDHRSQASSLVETVEGMFSESRADTAGLLIVASFLFATVAAALYLWAPKMEKTESEKAAVVQEAAEESAPDTSEVLSSAEQRAEAAMQDFESLAKTLVQSVAQKIGPKLAKGQAVRGILESRLYQFPDKAKTFLMNELNSTAGAVMRAVEAEEAMILLDLDNALSLNFPPVPLACFLHDTFGLEQLEGTGQP
ncbi:unnamed protein product [Effrenium voratum]|uniref:Uncharacterized protein n=1 Tax=Effrenium voratum TaxID=2562239 RepID=A0AA36I3K9_9DINO|nr:unnamed protein product [Effrenium voratum]